MLVCAQDDIMSFEEEKQVLYLHVYRPVYFQLVDVLLHKCHYPSQQEYESWSPEDKEQFRIYRWGRLPGERQRKARRQSSESHLQFVFFRVDISDTLMYVYEMLGVELLSNLYDRLGRQLMDPQLSAVWQVVVIVV